jgi:hypothetical protein
LRRRPGRPRGGVDALIWGVMHFTYHNQDVYLEAVSTAKAREAGAPETEIKITLEMIEAGALELSRFNPDFEAPEDAVIRIYREMAMAGALIRKYGHSQ